MLKDKIDQRIKEREKISHSVQKEIESLAERVKELTDHDLKTYQLLNGADCLFYDSPISAFKTYQALKDQMIKCDMDFVGLALDGKDALKSFVEFAKDGSRWIFRFTDEPKAIKTGIEAIL